ncbi:hypothetical protein M2480_002257 [Parabacteroides sp. PFB2-12]|uniref:hypothetical protein n=1 Tax=unclassified Parabacteroides TaxID=2649774 RepID=UPI0024765C45|nr:MULTISPECIES: hypothetical protein [unclassified Parabacteroides]MDH6343904.1 hypothetical protein [Parabacteroides sp. PM6-13]MDH6391266.1 hypothetical protein [Parabacteroides sp. PFB2-12]
MAIVIKEIRVVTHIEKRRIEEETLSPDWMKKVQRMIEEENRRLIRKNNEQQRER